MELLEAPWVLPGYLVDFPDAYLLIFLAPAGARVLYQVLEEFQELAAQAYTFLYLAQALREHQVLPGYQASLVEAYLLFYLFQDRG